MPAARCTRRPEPMRWLLALLLVLGLGYYAWSNGVFSPEAEVPAEAAAPVQDAAG